MQKRNCFVTMRTISILCLIVIMFAFASCDKLKPTVEDKIEFSFLKNNECFSKYDLYLISGETISFCIPIFANKFIEETSEMFPIKYISASGENLDDVNIIADLDWISCDSKFNSIYVYKFILSAKSSWDSTVIERKITSIKFSYESTTSDFLVDINLKSSVIAPDELINDLSIVRNNTKYLSKSETDNNDMNTFPYPMTFYWECTAWGAVDITDLSKFATIKAMYFENSYFFLHNLNMHYHSIDNSDLINYLIENPLSFDYKLSQRTDTIDFNIKKKDEYSDYLFIGDNLIFEIEYNGVVHKVIVGNIQLNCRNSALERLFGE